ncbi:Na+/galactose cotransporter [Leptospira ognonensis]|uniref:Na+/galactose cotransporter n=1 Tax=Leptospira ognonensis TaxID=2484945 RepID=A0A4R9JXW6_9LEPT|nr:sodium:solute symporter family protein [Leptospira ognonensis]TGL56337.1 Na+/galactose cotransporter [Leptospira ognonensis]
MKTTLHPIDFLIIFVFVIFMIIIGYLLKRRMKGSVDFLLAGRKIPGWITGIAFISANISALELLGMSASGAEYGFLTFHFYYLGAIPGMIFLGIFMMPFYYSTRIRSVPEYLRYRFNRPAHLLNSVITLISLALGSGIYLYSLSLIFDIMFGWNPHLSILVSAMIVLLYTYFGGLSSSIYTEVMQFFLTVFGLFPLVYIGVVKSGGWESLMSQIPESHKHMWKYLPNGNNPLGWDILSVTVGLGFVLSFSYWTCGFAEVQRAMAAKDLQAARRTPLIGAVFKLFLPFLTVIPGLIAISQFKQELNGDYNKSFLILLREYYPSGMLGLGTTALLAAFMAGMSSSVTALNTIFTYDIFQTYIKKNESDAYYLKIGKRSTMVAVVFAIFASYIAMQFSNIMNYIQLLFSFFSSPLISIFLLGMFWKRASSWSAFWGMVTGTSAGIMHYILTTFGFLYYKSDMVSNFYGAIFSGLACFLSMVIVSFIEKPDHHRDLQGLMYSARDREHDFWNPIILAWGAGLIALLGCFNWFFR